MSAAQWSAKVGRGWLESAPPEVREMAEMNGGKEGLSYQFGISTGLHLGGHDQQRWAPFNRDPCPNGERHTIKQTLQSVTWLLAGFPELLAAEVPYDVVSLMFVNFTSDFSRHPTFPAADAPDVVTGLGVFLDLVNKSLEGLTAEEGVDWVMLSCSRVG